MPDFEKWTLSSLRVFYRKHFKDDTDVDAYKASELVSRLEGKLGDTDVKYHNWTKENLMNELKQLGLSTTGSKATLIATIKSHTEANDEKDEKKDNENRVSEESNDNSTSKKKVRSRSSSSSDSDSGGSGDDTTETQSKKHKKDTDVENEKEHKTENIDNKKSTGSPLKSALRSAGSPRQSAMRAPGSPSKRTRLSKTDKSDSASGSKLKFASVEVREYARRHGGGGGVPHHGAYPLGLDWEYDKDHVLKRGLTDFEELRENERHTKGTVPAVSEKERKNMLEAQDDRAVVERAGSFTKQKSDLDNLRKVRKNIGCECDGEDCKTSKCNCNKSGVECLEDYCSCSGCENPLNM